MEKKREPDTDVSGASKLGTSKNQQKVMSVYQVVYKKNIFISLFSHASFSFLVFGLTDAIHLLEYEYVLYIKIQFPF